MSALATHLAYVERHDRPAVVDEKLRNIVGEAEVNGVMFCSSVVTRGWLCRDIATENCLPTRTRAIACRIVLEAGTPQVWFFFTAPTNMPVNVDFVSKVRQR